MNKKGFLLAEETLKIIVALICIVFLVYLLVSLYYAKIQKEDLKKATLTVEKISLAVSTGGGRIDALTPEGWYLFSFLGDKRPSACAGKNCLCICDKKGSLNFWGSQEEKCNEGACLIVENLKYFSDIKIEDVADSITSIEIKKEGGLIVVSKVK